LCPGLGVCRFWKGMDIKMEITLRIIDKSNWEECIGLKVKETQTTFVASNAY